MHFHTFYPATWSADGAAGAQAAILDYVNKGNTQVVVQHERRAP